MAERNRRVAITSEDKRRHLSVRNRLLIVGGLGVLVVGGAYYYQSNRPLLGGTIVSDADFSVYIPKQAPSGYELQEKQTKLDDTTLTYSFKDEETEKVITVTVQPRPSGLDMKQLTEGGSINSVVTSNGTLYNLSAAGSSKYLLDAGDSLIFLTSPTLIDNATINALAESLIKQN